LPLKKVKYDLCIPAFKHALVDMYIERLKERQHRKTIAKDHGLITSKHKLTGTIV
jgi:hypothetical protein